MTAQTQTQTQNYTEDQTVALVTAYTMVKDADQATRDSVVQEFADAFGKSVVSIRSKLSNEGVYVTKTRTTKSGTKVVRKADLVNQIADAIGEDVEVIESLEKATKQTLLKVLYAVQ
jgi:response regulator RpfG family c-di-GMP phosphodiesterase